MGYLIIIGNCICCQKIFGFNPHKVPSIRVEGKREPICEVCVNRVNIRRRAKGMSVIEVAKDAYQPTEE